MASVAEEKITLYLLNPAHPVGRSKAAFFLRFGFSAARWELLSDALIEHAHAHDVVAVEKSTYGTRYVVDGLLEAPDGTRLNVRCAWFIGSGGQIPRFITAHPLPKP